jgi:hypothetical protein
MWRATGGELDNGLVRTESMALVPERATMTGRRAVGQRFQTNTG